MLGMDFGRSMLETLERLESECNIKLSKYQRLLLSEVATVEQMLSIITNSPIIVEVIKQEQNGYEMLREVWLKDSNNSRLLHATTKYNLAPLPYGIALDMQEGRIGIGTSIARHELPTYRKIVEIGYNNNSKMLHRKYQIIKDATVLFEIFEEFSAELFRES